MGKNDVTEDSNIVDFENQISFVTLLCIFLIERKSSILLLAVWDGYFIRNIGWFDFDNVI